MDERRSERSYETVRVPAALRDRVDGLFREYRGYEPASFQESLSLACDVAAGRLSPEDAPADPEREREPERGDAAGRTDRTGDPDGTGESPATAAADRPAAPAGAGGRARAIEEVFPRDWDAEETARRFLPRVVDAYVEHTGEPADRGERVEAAIGAVAADAGVSPAGLRETLVDRLYGGVGISSSLAEEFFQEALAAAAEVDDRPPTGVRAAASDGGEQNDVRRVSSDRSADGGVASESGEFSVEALLTDHDAEPTADCEECGVRTAIDDLDTVIGPEDGSTVRLLCRACSDGA